MFNNNKNKKTKNKKDGFYCYIYIALLLLLLLLGSNRDLKYDTNALKKNSLNRNHLINLKFSFLQPPSGDS